MVDRNELAGQSIFVPLMRRLRKPWIAGLFLLGSVILILVSLLISDRASGGWATAGNIGIVLFPALIGIWSIADTVAKNKEEEDQKKRQSDSLKKALGPIGQLLKEIADTPEGEWTPARVHEQRERVLEMIRTLLDDAGVPNPRVCLYKINLDAENTDDLGNQSAGAERGAIVGPSVDTLSYVAHRGGTTPKDLYLRQADGSGNVFYTSRRNQERSEPQQELNCKTLFDPVESRNPTRENSRSGYSSDIHNWRSSVRVPILVDRDVDHLLTADTKIEHGLPPELDQLVETGAVVLQLLTSVVDDGIANHDVAEKLKERFHKGRG